MTILVNLTMKNFKNIAVSVLGTIMIVGLIIPSFSSAHSSAQVLPKINRQAKQVATSTKGEATFCSRFLETAGKIDQKVRERESKLEAKKTERLNTLTNRKNERDDKLAKNHSKRDENLNEHFAKLEARAQNDVQKQAIAAFKAVMEKALNDRRMAVNAAIKAFRDGIQSAIDSRKAKVDAAIASFKSAEQAVIEKAKADCAAGIDVRTVKQTFQTSLKTARENLVKSRQEIDKRQDAMKPLIEAKKQAMEKAQADFKAAVEKAKDELKAALGQSGTSTSTNQSE